MIRRRVVLVLAAAVCVSAPLARGQQNRSALIPPSEANRLGLERAWFTHVALDNARGRVAHLTQHVSSTDRYTVMDVEYDGGKHTFTERDLDRLGTPLGLEGARKLAQRAVEDLTLLERNPKLTTHVVPEITLYAVSDRGMLHAIDAETGRTRWSTGIGNPDFPSEAVAANDYYVAAVNGSRLSLLDKNTGKIIWERQVVGAPGAGPAITERYVFAPMLSGAMEAYDIEAPRERPWMFRSHGRPMLRPIYTGSHVVWTTDRGHLNVAEGNENLIRYRLETDKPIAAEAAFLAPNRIVVASTDGYVYCIEEHQGSVYWRFSTGEPIVQAPVVLEGVIYVITENETLFAITGDRGAEIWQTGGYRSLVTASKDRLYCIDVRGRLTSLDVATGSVLGSLDTATLDLVVTNPQTDRIFIGTRRGTLQCLHEIGQPWPLIHAGVLRAKEVERKRPPKKKAEAEKAAPAADDDNPFGLPAAPAAKKPSAKEEPATDPFSGEPATGAAKPEPATGSDPFGSSDPFGGGEAEKPEAPAETSPF